MLEKIVSGGQTGADRAALDAAIRLGIPHGGWIPKGRLAEDGPLPARYRLVAMPTRSYQKRTEQNVIDSDGTVIISTGKLTGGSALTRRFAKRHGRPFLHLDLEQTPKYLAASEILDWMEEYDIRVLNVAGPRASKEPTLYDDVRKIIEGAFYLGAVRQSMNAPGPDNPRLPGSVDDAAGKILETLSLDERVRIANMTERELAALKLGMVSYVQARIDVCGISKPLKEDCIRIAGRELDEAGASRVIIDEVWRILKETHTLRVV